MPRTSTAASLWGSIGLELEREVIVSSFTLRTVFVFAEL